MARDDELEHEGLMDIDNHVFPLLRDIVAADDPDENCYAFLALPLRT